MGMPNQPRNDLSSIKVAIHHKLIQKLDLERINQLDRNTVKAEVTEMVEALAAEENAPMTLTERERLGTTGMGQGIAIPHGRIKGIKEAIGAVLRLANPVPFESPDGQPVSLLVVQLVPEAATERHLQVLSDLAQMFSDRGFREGLLTASDADTIQRNIQQWNTN